MDFGDEQDMLQNFANPPKHNKVFFCVLPLLVNFLQQHCSSPVIAAAPILMQHYIVTTNFSGSITLKVNSSIIKEV